MQIFQVMRNLVNQISLKVHERTYLKDPESSELGQKIISHSINLLAELGFDHFTFRKLAVEIQSTEASIYRYFESKHKLLLYLMSWYWAWMEYRMVFSLNNIESAEKRLERAIEILSGLISEDQKFGHINEEKLHRIVNSESPKAYLTKEVDNENSEGVFSGYKSLVSRVSDIILEINPAFKYPHMLVSTVIEGTHQQRFFADHLPRLTDVVVGEDSIPTFYKEMVFSTIKP
jgi:AcrR family transcriptional regulator